MLDSNTNKVTWVAIAVGVIAVLGVATAALFPQAFDSGKNAMTQTLIYQAATPHELKFNGEAKLSKANGDHEPNWNFLEYPLNFPGQERIVTKPGQWTLMEFYFKADKDADYVALDINNSPAVGPQKTNDNDNLDDRKIVWYDEDGKILAQSHVLGPNVIKAGKVYRVVARYHNTNDYDIYQGFDRAASNFGFRNVGGIKDDSSVNIKFYNYRVY